MMQDAHQNSLNFYISYDGADRFWAEWIAWQLENAHYSTMLEAWDLQPGANFVLKKDEALKKAERVITVLSPDYLNAASTQTDWAAAFSQDPGTLLPVRVRKCEPKGLLGPIRYIELVGLNELLARETLLSGVSRGRNKPTSAPPFPGELQEAASGQPHFPGYLPPIWRVPPYNPFFTNREDILTNLYSALRAGKAGLIQVQAIGGLGGSGKTQTALAYAYLHSYNYQTVLWVNADKLETLVSDLKSIAGLLRLSEKDSKDQNIIFSAIKDWLNDHTDWLLILDNIEDSKIAHDFIPSVGNGHILLTTRAQAVGKTATVQPVELDELRLEDGALFLLRRARIIGSNATLDDASDVDRDKAYEISQVLGSLPLALDQAGAYIEETACLLEDYLNRYLKQRARLLKRRGGIPSDHPSDHPDPVATTWSVSFKKVQQAHPGAIKALQLCAFLNPDIIPEEIITEGITEIKDELDDVIAELRKYSLLHRNATTRALTIHRLVQAVLRDEMDEDTQRQWAECAVQAVNRAFLNAEPVGWQHCQRYFPHVQICAALIEQWGIGCAEATQLLHRMGYHLQAHVQNAHSEPLFIKALSIWKKTQGAEFPYIAIVLANYAYLLRKLNSDIEAAQLETFAEAIRAGYNQKNLVSE